MDAYILDARLPLVGELFITPYAFDNIFIIYDSDNILEKIKNDILSEPRDNVFFVKSNFEKLSIALILKIIAPKCCFFFVDPIGNKNMYTASLSAGHIKVLKSTVTSVEYLSIYDCLLELLNVDIIPVEILGFLRDIINSLQNIAELDCKLMYKESFHDEISIMKWKDNTCLDNLQLNEFILAMQKYEEVFNGKSLFSKDFKIKKVDLLKRASALVSQDASSLDKVDGYPTVCKFYSSYFYECARIQMKVGFYAMSFMYFFRSLETYCDGFLILSGDAEIRDFYNKNGVLKMKNTFLLKEKLASNSKENWSPVNGFGKKWNKILETSACKSVPNYILQHLEDLKNLRNNFMLTHGDVNVNKNILQEFDKSLKSFISCMEISSGQKNSKWIDICNMFEHFNKINVDEEIRGFFEDELLLVLTKAPSN